MLQWSEREKLLETRKLNCSFTDGMGASANGTLMGMTHFHHADKRTRDSRMSSPPKTLRERRNLRQLHAGAQRDLHEVHDLRRDQRLLVR